MVDNGAEAGILQGNGLAFDEYIFVGVGEAGAIGGPHLINGAMVICAEEGAGSGFDHIVTIDVQVQVLVDESAFFHTQVLADAFDVWCFEPGGVILAAVGATEAVYFRNRFFMKLLLVFENEILVRPFQETGIFFLPFF